MAKTRAQSRAENSKKLNANLKPNKRVKTYVKLKECFIRLDRIDVNSFQVLGSEKTEYSLRKRASNPVVKIPKLKPEKKLNQIVALSQSALYTSRAARLWETIKKQYDQQNVKIKIDDIVFARMAGHRPWPSKLIEFRRNGVHVKFFGTNEVGTLKKIEIVPYELCQEMIEQYLKVPIADLSARTLMYHMSFIKAIKEVSCFNV